MCCCETLLRFDILVAELISVTMSSCMKNPPKLEDDSAYEEWRKDILLWTQLTELDKKKQAISIHLSLTGLARSASSEIPAEDLSKDNSVNILLDKLDGLFLPDKGRRQFTAFHNLYTLKRGSDEDIHMFISRFEHAYFKFKQQGMNIPGSVQAFLMLAAAEFTESERMLVMSSITDINFHNMKEVLKRVFGANISQKCTKDNFDPSEVKCEPIFQANREDSNNVLYANRGRGAHAHNGAGFNQNNRRHNNNNNGGRPANYSYPARDRNYNHNKDRKMNPMNNFGKVSQCRNCGSLYHWARECPGRYDRNEGEIDDKIVHLSLFMGNDAIARQNSKLQTLLEESLGYAVLDTGCSATVCGIDWYNSYVDNLSEFDKSTISELPSSSTFVFGDGVSVKSVKKAIFPCYLNGKRSTITADVVDCNIPLLLSKSSMKNAGMCLNFKYDTINIGEMDINLTTSSSGHYLLPISL